MIYQANFGFRLELFFYVFSAMDGKKKTGKISRMKTLKIEITRVQKVRGHKNGCRSTLRTFSPPSSLLHTYLDLYSSLSRSISSLPRFVFSFVFCHLLSLINNTTVMLSHKSQSHHRIIQGINISLIPTNR